MKYFSISATLALACLVSACQTSRAPAPGSPSPLFFILPRGKQEHRIVARNEKNETVQSFSAFLNLEERTGRVQGLSPLGVTLFRAVVQPGRLGKLELFEPSLERARDHIEKLLGELSELFFAKNPARLQEAPFRKAKFVDGKLESFEMDLRSMRVEVEIKPL